MELKRKVVVRKIGDETILIPVGKMVNDYNGVFNLSPTGAVAFEAIEKGADRDEIIKIISDEFDASYDEIVSDVDNFLDKLTEFGII